MSVEKMHLVQIVGRLDRYEAIAAKILENKSIYFVDAMKMIQNYSFTINVKANNVERTLDFNDVTTFEKNNHYEALAKKLDRFFEENKLEKENANVRKNLNPSEIQAVLDEVDRAKDTIERFQSDIQALERDQETLRLFEANDIPITAIKSMKHFEYAYGTLTDLGRKTIKGNYENIPGVVIHLGQMDGEEVYVMIYPKKLSEAIHRVKDSLNWKDIPMISRYEGPNEVIRTQIANALQVITSREEQALRAMNDTLQANKDLLLDARYSIDTLEKVERAKQYMARSAHYFYMAGWVADSEIKETKRAVSEEQDLLFKVLSDDEVPDQPPTKLKNSKLFAPFEALVKMYGMPNYREIDPTPFFAITYMILFGAMFGDLGQGAVFALAGWILTKKRHPNLGGVLMRIGLASMVFGVLYGSIFGNEHVLPALLIKPFENITTVLVFAIGFGVLLTSFAYVLGIVNKLKAGNIEEGLFGKEGVAGFLLFLCFIMLVLGVVGYHLLPTPVIVGLMILCIASIVVKQPLANKLLGKTKLYDEDAGSYYVEGAFSIVEALLSIFSGTISFIRVGAFAINHVGLFMAFQTMGQMMGGVGNIVILILGNLVIIGLEGLIVFIQSLRLEYYELFSKYYEGDGIPYEQ